MKRFAILALFLALFAPLDLLADEELEIYRMIYRQAEGLRQKYAAAQNLVALADRASAPVVAEALEGLLRDRLTYRDASERELLGRTVRLLAAALGEYKYIDAAPLLWQAVEEFPDPLAKAEALDALGRMRALDYAERIALLLASLNLSPSADREAGERVAYGCILALERLKDPRGFSPVFYAADGWYSPRIKLQAERSLPSIAADPTDMIKELISQEMPRRKILALRLNANSTASLERKSEAAILALSVGHLQAPRDKTEAQSFNDLRKLALRSLVAFKTNSPLSAASCRESFDKGLDEEERLLALSALGVNGNDAAAETLRDIILKLNQDQRAGLSDEIRNRMAKAAVENAGINGNKHLRPALLALTANDSWSGGILLAAQQALALLR